MHYSLEVYDVSSMLYAGQFSSKYSSRQDMIGGTITFHVVESVMCYSQ